jgi:flavin reductase (DIM6/NTAB) family NADH-FMN oxidoreductase RutF
MKKVFLKDFKTDIFTLFDKKWGLLTSGDKSNYNMMTISWGTLGTLWSKPVGIVFVRPQRYTHKFMNENEYFSVSFFDESYKNLLGILGSKSGKDIDKMNIKELESLDIENALAFKEAELTLIFRKIYVDKLKENNFIAKDIAKDIYPTKDFHSVYIGELVDIYVKD